jgi:hypothetical protein
VDKKTIVLIVLGAMMFVPVILGFLGWMPWMLVAFFFVASVGIFALTGMAEKSERERSRDSVQGVMWLIGAAVLLWIYIGERF